MQFSRTLTVHLLNLERRYWIAHYRRGRDERDWRFGQYICNVYLDRGSFPELFNCEDAEEAYSIALKVILSNKEHGVVI
jgi:hypothetical protein